MPLEPHGGLRALGKNAQGFEEAENPRDGTVLVCIPAATFTMGTDAHDDARPSHAVSLDGYWIARTPVTNGQYRRFVSATNHRSAGDWETYARQWGDPCPVIRVSWSDAVAYATWAGLRLPTEAEWEHAARGPEGLRYPWGNDFDASRCRSSVGGDAGSAERPVPVGSFPQGTSPFGCLDLAGNVAEWCSSLHAPYPYRADDGRERLDTRGGDQRVLRGASWFNDVPDWFCGFARGRGNPSVIYRDRGFRCAKSAPRD